MYILIIKYNYTILNNTYIWFEEYGTSTKMNDEGWMWVDRRGQMDEIGQMNVDGRWTEVHERWTKVDGHRTKL